MELYIIWPFLTTFFHLSINNIFEVDPYCGLYLYLIHWHGHVILHWMDVKCKFLSPSQELAQVLEPHPSLTESETLGISFLLSTSK